MSSPEAPSAPAWTIGPFESVQRGTVALDELLNDARPDEACAPAWGRTKLAAELAHSHLSALRSACVAGACALLLLAPPACACPRCAEGMQARQAVLHEDFGRNLAVAALPFLLIGALCARLDAIGKNGERRLSKRVSARIERE